MSDDLTPDGDPLTALAVLDPADLAVRPLAEISGRAAQVRRARRVRTTVLGAAASVTLVASLALVLPTGTSTSQPATTTTPPAPTPTATAPVDCTQESGFGPTARPELVHLLTGPGAPRLSSASGIDIPGAECTGVPTPIAAVRARLAADGSVVTAGLVVTGPSDAELPYSFDPAAAATPTPGVTPDETASGAADLMAGLVREQATVHGTRATVWRWTAQSEVLLTRGTAFVEWQEPSTGKWWVVQSSGLSRDEVVAVAEGLGTDGALDQATVPGASDGWTTLPVDAGGRSGHRFDATYEVGGDMGGLNLSVSDVPQYGNDLVGAVSPGTVKVGDVDGARAYLRPIGVDGDSPGLQWSRDGLWFLLQAGPGTTFEQLLDRARSVERVSVDDPRIRQMQAAWEAYAASTATPGAAPSSATATAVPTEEPTAGPVTTTPGDVVPSTRTDAATATVSPLPTPTVT